MKLTILTLATVAICLAQSFEVTSVKANHSGSGPSRYPRLTKGKLSATNITVKSMLEVAYGVNSQQIGGPAWIDSDRFDLAATSPEGVADTEVKPMLQALMKDRFGLAAHIEMREMPVYNMVVGRDKLKIRPFDPAVAPLHPAMMPGATNATAGNQTMPEIADLLGRITGRPVIDKTGLEGRYAYFIQYGQLGGTSGPEQAPDIFGAVQEQLGLKLESARASLRMIVVDNINRTPTEN